MSLKSSAKASRAKPLTLKRRYVAARFDAQFGGPLCGLDEVGRAPLAGPVVAACVYIPEDTEKHRIWNYINDSKRLSHEIRETLYDDIAGNCAHGIGAVEPTEIDKINIHHASLLAMRRAYDAMLASMADQPGELLALVDGKFPPPLPCRIQTIIKGDGLSLRIGAASILAKVWRDRLMMKMHEEYPMYGWDSNVGYPTPVHLAAIKVHGISEHHRRSFAPCQQRQLPL
jgi:ribonuclease HII